MKKILALACATVFLLTAAAQQKKAPATLKSILLEQLRTTHQVKDWFVPAYAAIDGLTPEQAMWKDSSGNHSIGQLTSHLIFWDLSMLNKFKGNKELPFDGNNDETFNTFNSQNWRATVQRLDSVLTAWEMAVEGADETKLQSWYSQIAHIGTHNAYHTGQIIYIRKQHGWWDPEKGVK